MRTGIQQNANQLTGAILLACALALPLGAKSDEQVTRPFRSLGLMTVVVTPISLTTATFHNEEDGHGTHTGRYHNVADGTMSLETGQFLSGKGTSTVANGDTAHWSWDGTKAIFEGGSGRFENLSGFMVMAEILFQSDPFFNPDGTFTITILYCGEGELTF